VQAICARHGLDYLHLDAQSVDAQGRLKRGLLNADPRDHHSNAVEHAELIAPRLAPLLAPADCRAAIAVAPVISRNAEGWRARCARALRRLLVG